MRDLYLLTPIDREKASWYLDIDIIDGVPRHVPYERNTQDQRAAIAAYTVRGSIPGKPDVGVDWSALYMQDATVLDIDNEIKQNMQKYAATGGTASQQYMPLYLRDKDGVHVVVCQAS